MTMAGGRLKVQRARTWPEILVVCLLAAAAGCKRKEIQTVVAKVAAPLLRGNSFQTGADLVRLRHLKYYGELLDEFHSKTGSYPLQGRRDFPIYVHVGHEGQQPSPDDAPAYQHEVVAMVDFVAALELGLGGLSMSATTRSWGPSASRISTSACPRPPQASQSPSQRRGIELRCSLVLAGG